MSKSLRLSQQFTKALNDAPISACLNQLPFLFSIFYVNLGPYILYISKLRANLLPGFSTKL